MPGVKALLSTPGLLESDTHDPTRSGVAVPLLPDILRLASEMLAYLRARMMSQTKAAPECITLGEVARRIGCPLWQVRRLYERKILSEPPRCGRFRMVTTADIPAIRAALVEQGYLAG